jgi:pheromone shutdown protein TraB
MTYDDNPSGANRDGRLHDLATRAVDSLLTLVHRGTRLAFGTMIIVIIVCLGCFALGIAALSEGIETVWIIFGGFAAFVAIGAVGLAMFRLWAITRLGTALITDVERLIAGDPRSERVVIETIEASDGVQDQSAVVMSRQFFAMSDTVGTAGQFTALAIALKSVTTFPLLILLATVITLGMACLSLLFLLGILL